MFKVVVLQSDLMQALKCLESTVGNNAMNLGDNCISIVSNKSLGICELTTTNTIEWTKINLICSNINSNDVAPHVDFIRLCKIISTIPSNDYVTLEDSGNNELMISYAMKKPFVLNGNTNGFMQLPSVQPVNTQDISCKFLLDSIKYTKNIIKPSGNHTMYDCIKITINPNEYITEAIDSSTMRTCYFSIPNSVGCNSITSYVLELEKLSKSMKLLQMFQDLEISNDANSDIVIIQNVSGTTSNICSNIIDVVYYVRNVSGNFPDIKKVYANANLPSDTISVNSMELLKCIERIKAIADTTADKITVTIDKNNFIVSYKSSYGIIEDSIDVDVSSTGLYVKDFSFNHLENIIKNIPDTTVSFGEQPQTNHFLITGGTVKDILYTISPATSNNP